MLSTEVHVPDDVLPSGPVDQGELEEGAEDEGETDPDPDVDCLGVADGREVGIDSGSLGCHGQEGGHSQGHPGRDTVLVQPEGDPRHGDQHERWNVQLQQIVGELPFEFDDGSETGIGSWRGVSKRERAAPTCIGDGGAVACVDL